ncbi:MAG: hypothetical protein ACTS3R_11350 [Inquilinaceae bacterium]
MPPTDQIGQYGRDRKGNGRREAGYERDARDREVGVRAAGFMCGRAIWSDGIAAFGRGGARGLSDWLLTNGRGRLKAAL